jgi:hypothetical protein
MSRLEQRIYVEVETARLFMEASVLLPWPDIHLPHGWHLNQARVSVPAIPVRPYSPPGDPTMAGMPAARSKEGLCPRRRFSTLGKVIRG